MRSLLHRWPHSRGRRVIRCSSKPCHGSPALFAIAGLIKDRNLFGFGDYYDRNFDVRFRLLKEGRYRPAVALGLQDFAGTGIFGGEYLVATKGFELPQVPGRFKVTTGLGWGRLATSGSIASVGTRPRFASGDTGGELSVDQWFRGDIAPFGGIEWTHGKWGLKAEYSSDIYDQETRQSDVFERRSSLNFGVEYQASRQLRLGAYYLYGDAIGVNAQLQLNPRHPPTPLQVAAPYPVVPRSAWAKDDTLWSQGWVKREAAKQSLRQALSEAMTAQNLILESVTFGPTEAEVRFRNTKFRSETNAVGRAARAMAATLPASVETFHIVLVSRGLGLSRVTLRRSDLEALQFSPEAGDAIWAVSQVGDAGPAPEAAELVEELYPAFATSISPYFNPSYFDPTLPFRIDLGLSFGASYSPAPGWRIAGVINQRLWGNVAEGRRYPSALPAVRTDFHEYAVAETVLNRLYVERSWQMGAGLYARSTLGYLENMYGGISGEILWKPLNSRFGLGADLNYVRQRDYDMRFSFRDYSVLTGHASAYLELPHNYLAQVDVGRYLAGDIGTTVTLVREFNNGWRLGGFFTLTDVSSEEFGEGSFDKGLFLSIPLDWLIGQPSRNNYGVLIRPVQRDGGQKVNLPRRLFQEVRGIHRRSLAAQRSRFWQ